MAWNYLEACFNIRQYKGEVVGEDFVEFEHYEWVVLNVLCNRANNKTGRCFPGYNTIAEDCRISPRKAFDSVKNLERLSILRKQNTRSSNTYYIDLNRMLALADVEEELKDENESSSRKRMRTGKTYRRVEPQPQGVMVAFATLPERRQKMLRAEFYDWENDQLADGPDFPFERWLEKVKLVNEPSALSYNFEDEEDEVG